MACGDRYKNLAVTVSGYNFDKPYGTLFGQPWATNSDYDEWVALAEKMMAQAMTRFKRLAAVECAKTGGTNCAVHKLPGGLAPFDPKLVLTNQLQVLVTQMQQQYDDLYSDWLVGVIGKDIATAIGEAQTVVSTALCVMDQADRDVETYGGDVIVVPGVVPGADDGIPWWLWAAGGVGITVGALVLSKRWIRGRRERSASPSPRRATPRPAATGNERLAEDALSQSR